MSLLGIGSMVGLVLGLVHAAYVYRVVAENGPAENGTGLVRGLYYALWTVGLWVLFGFYVLVLWLAGLVCYAGFRLLRSWT